ncbi:hypothetical protein [Chromohalobacter israelensis]|uniref:hypothetical protein n=1 Tax=Chromohalobacter israelensis TaxID=141390 RepID=UPI003D7B9D96
MATPYLMGHVLRLVIETALTSLIETTDSAEERERREDQKRRFELMLLSIRMNVASVTRRHASVIRAIQNGDRTDSSILQLDENEAIAMDNAKTLYEQVKAHTRT